MGIRTHLGLTSVQVDEQPFGSPSAPAAQWTGAHKGPAFFAYSDNYLIDVKFGVIVDVEACRSIRQAEVGAARTMRLNRAALRSQAGTARRRYPLRVSAMLN